MVRPELYSDPAFKAMAARLSLALGGLDQDEAARLLMHLGRPHLHGKPPQAPRAPASPSPSSPLAATAARGEDPLKRPSALSSSAAGMK